MPDFKTVERNVKVGERGVVYLAPDAQIITPTGNSISVENLGLVDLRGEMLDSGQRVAVSDLGDKALKLRVEVKRPGQTDITIRSPKGSRRLLIHAI